MTKYILHGGHVRFINKYNNSFFAEIANSIPKSGTVLLNYFSALNKDINKYAKEDTKKLSTYGKNLNIKTVIADSKRFVQQLKLADALYMRGGRNPLIFNRLGKIKNLERLFEGKVIAGSSAGAYVLVKHFYGNITHRLRDGLGILNVKAYCHFKQKDTGVVKRLLEYGDKNIPLITLPVYKWVILYK